jgi:hypothetical protein
MVLLLIAQRDESPEEKQEVRQEPQWQKASLSGDRKFRLNVGHPAGGSFSVQIS